MSNGSLLAALRFRNFRNLWIGSLSSYAGQWIQQTTIAWLAYDMTGSSSMLGAIFGMRAIPMFLCAPLAGVAAVLDRPVRLTIIFDLVPRESAMQAVALNMIAFSVTRVCGPAAAGYLIGWFGAAGNLFVQSAAYFIAAATALVIVFPRFQPRATRRSAFSELAEGVRFAVTDPNARVLLLTGIMPFYLLVPVFAGLLPIYAKDIYGAGPEVLGVLLTSVGAGGVAGGWLAGKCMRYARQGMVQAFRRDHSAYEAARFKLQGLAPDAHYSITNLDSGDGAQELTGHALMETGLLVPITTRPGSATILYKQL